MTPSHSPLILSSILGVASILAAPKPRPLDSSHSPNQLILVEPLAIPKCAPHYCRYRLTFVRHSPPNPIVYATISRKGKLTLTSGTLSTSAGITKGAFVPRFMPIVFTFLGQDYLSFSGVRTSTRPQGSRAMQGYLLFCVWC